MVKRRNGAKIQFPVARRNQANQTVLLLTFHRVDALLIRNAKRDDD